MTRHLLGVLLGALCICTGFSLGGEEVRRVRALSGFLELIAHVRYEISSFLTRRTELFLQFECADLSACGFLASLRSAEKLGSENPLYAALLESRESLALSKEDFRLLSEWARRLGEVDATEELARAEKTRAALSESYEKQRGDVRQKVSLYRAIGVVAALCVWLFVW